MTAEAFNSPVEALSESLLRLASKFIGGTEEAREQYRNNHGVRFDAYFGRALGVFLQALPPEYRRQ